MRIPDDIKDLIFELITGYPFHTNRIAKEVEEHRELARKEKLLRNIEEYESAFELFREDVEVIKIRNRQKKYEFELLVSTVEVKFPIEKIIGSLTKFDSRNRNLKWDIENRVPVREEAHDYKTKLNNALILLNEDIRKIDNLLSEIRPFIDQPF